MAQTATREIALSLIIPTYNERNNLKATLGQLEKALKRNKIAYQIVIVDDNSPDGTGRWAQQQAKQNKHLKVIIRKYDRGFGSAIARGMQESRGKFLVPVMADLSDSPKDIVTMYRKITAGYDVVYTTRFAKGGKAHDYPFAKLVSNRLYNFAVAVLFLMPYFDTSNALKMYNSKLAKSMQLSSPGFAISAEMAIKAYLKARRTAEVGVQWHNRTEGEAKFRLFKTWSAYTRLLLTLFLRRILGMRIR